MPTTAELHGTSYSWGFQSTDAPPISGFTPRRAEITAEPEVYSEAKDGEGMVESIAITVANKRMITGTITGYIPVSVIGGSASLPTTFSWAMGGSLGTRFFFIKKISEPRVKGEYTEVTLDIASNANVGS